MKNLFKILVFITIIFVIGAIYVYISYDKTITNLKIKEVGEINNTNDIEKDTNILVSGIFKSKSEKITDEKYKFSVPYQMLKRVRNALKGVKWEDEEPVYIFNEISIKNLKISDEILKNLEGYELLTEGSDYEINDKDLVPMHYSDSEDLFFTTMEETGFWRLRYYKNEISQDKEYTVVGKWNGTEIVPIEGFEKSLYEGNITVKELDYQKNGIKQNLVNIIPYVFAALGLAVIVTYILSRKNTVEK